MPLCRVVPSLIDGQGWVVDSVQQALPMQLRGDVGFMLLAVSGGKPVDVSAEYDGRTVRPLSVVASGEWLSLASPVVGAA